MLYFINVMAFLGVAGFLGIGSVSLWQYSQGNSPQALMWGLMALVWLGGSLINFFSFRIYKIYRKMT